MNGVQSKRRKKSELQPPQCVSADTQKKQRNESPVEEENERNETKRRRVRHITHVLVTEATSSPIEHTPQQRKKGGRKKKKKKESVTAHVPPTPVVCGGTRASPALSVFSVAPVADASPSPSEGH